MNDYIEREASLDEEEDEVEDEELDEGGDARRKQADGAKRRNNRDFEDSSEEEDEDDEEELNRIRAGFIVDDEEEEEDEEEQEDGTTVKVKKRKKRRRSREDEDDEGLDEEDIDLMVENTGGGTRASSKFKRLKRGREENDRRNRQQSRELDEIFSDEEPDAPGDVDDERFYESGRRGQEGDRLDEFDDFIEEDEMSDEEQRRGSEDEMMIRRHERRQQRLDMGNAGIPVSAMSDMQDIFGTGEEYEFALVTELDEAAEIEDGTRDLAIHDVFEPSELQEKLLTEEDSLIKWKDVPERFQLARKQFEKIEIQPDSPELIEEGNYITTQMMLKRQIERDLEEPFANAVKAVVKFIAVENFEVPFIIQHRKDYLIHAEKIPKQHYNEGEPPYELETRKMLVQDDLWEIVELDIKFRHILDKRNSLMTLYNKLKDHAGVEDALIEDGFNHFENVEHFTDLYDYMQFRYSSELKDISTADGTAGGHRRPTGARTFYERVRKGNVYNLVNAFGISAAQFATNVSVNKKREFAEDPEDLPHVMADQFLDPPDFSTAEKAFQAAKYTLAEEIYNEPRMRKALRGKWFTLGLIHVDVQEKGVRQIDEQHQYYEFKYLRNQNLYDISERPAMYLKMMKAEEEKFIEINIDLKDQNKLLSGLYDFITSENYSEVADAWNRERREIVDLAMNRFKKLFAKSLKEELKVLCEDRVASQLRRNCLEKLDQTPYKPKALALGETPRAFTISNGRGERGRDATVGVFMDENGRVIDNVKYDDLRDEDTRETLAELLRKRRPDVIGVAGFSVQTNRLMDDLKKLVQDKDITVSSDDRDESSLIECVWVQDEVARLYQNSKRAQVDHPDLAPLTRYCVGLARYLQSPILEYAALGQDIKSINFHPAQQLISEDKLWKSIEAAMVEVVNLVGVDINQAVIDPYIGNLLPYVSGLGPRKADSMRKAIAANGGRVLRRDQLLTTEEGRNPIVFPKIFENCAAFLIIPYEPKDPSSDYLDSTRVHPEDYDLGRKMAADALDFDEEDIQAAVEDGGPSAVIDMLTKKHEEDKLDDLILEEYAEILERNFNQLKRATLEAVRAELQAPYEELRQRFKRLSDEEVFTMLTGETRETLDERMVVPVNIRRVTDRYISARLDCGIEGNIALEEMPSDSMSFRPSHFFHMDQTVQARIESLNRKTFYAELSLREDKIRQPKRSVHHALAYSQDKWDDEREEKDKARLAVKNQEQTRTVRVIKHPLFRPFNSKQAEEFLSGQSRGDAVIRPSSMGPDHIAVTWKVSDRIYQHVDVLELDKLNEFTVGRTLRVGGKYSYSDLDELIVNHIKSMARKIDELTSNQKFQPGSKEDAEKWLEKYCEANPKRSSYCFCFDAKRPGYFYLVYKAGANALIGNWHVKVVPGAFELRHTTYPDVMTLCNGFKTMFTHQATRRARM